MIKRTKVADFKSLRNLEMLNSSYRNLGYPMGCSESELEAALEEGHLTLSTRNDGIAGFARIKSLAAYNCYYDFYLQVDLNADEIVEELHEHILEFIDVNRFYVQLLPYEKREISCLERVGYRLEATLERQIFINSSYHDLLIMGKPA